MFVAESFFDESHSDLHSHLFTGGERSPWCCQKRPGRLSSSQKPLGFCKAVIEKITQPRADKFVIGRPRENSERRFQLENDNALHRSREKVCVCRVKDSK